MLCQSHWDTFWQLIRTANKWSRSSNEVIMGSESARSYCKRVFEVPIRKDSGNVLCQEVLLRDLLEETLCREFFLSSCARILC